MAAADKNSRSILRWMWRDYLSEHRVIFVIAFVLMVIEGAMLAALSYVVQPMFDHIFIAGDRGAIPWIATAIAAIFLIRAFAGFGQKTLMQLAGLRVIAAMQQKMVRHILTLDSAYFQSHPPGTLIERVRGDTSVANNVWGTVLVAAGRDFFGMLGLLAVALSIDVIWTLVAIAAVPMMLVPIWVLQKYVRKTTHAAREAAARLSTRLDEIFHGVNTIKLNTSEELERRRFGGVMSVFMNKEIKARVAQAAIPVMADIVAAAGFAGVVVYGGGQIIDGDKSVGEFMSFFTAMGLLFDPVRRLANVTGIWQSARASLERIQSVFEERPTILPPPSPQILEAASQADIQFSDVRLSYGGEPALNGLSFIAKAGETTALVGASGAGKSTVFNVLTRLIDPESGKLSIGELETRDLALADLRALFSVVTQDAPMFDDSLRDNVVLATEGVSDDSIEKALKASHLSEFVASLPEGLETQVGPRGSALSGGQRQRVAIARALLRDAPILLLDEATSALDAASEAHVQAALDELSKARTTLVIAHRLSTIRQADKIVVMDRGRAVDEGTHEELLARGGTYASLYELQFSED